MKSEPKVDLAPPRGMRDFYPENAARQEFIFDAWKRAARRHGFVRFDACVVENLSLLTRKAGEEIVDQIYSFSDKSRRRLALRPEVTPSLARMVAARRNELGLPLKWFTIAQCFRYERASLGRKREHYQWNLDVIGASAPAAEIEILATALSATAALGLLSDIRVHISNRALLADLLAHAGIPCDQHQILFLLLDKRGKMSDGTIREILTGKGFTTHLIGRIFELFELRDLEDARQALGGTTPALEDTAAVFEGLAAYGWRDQICFDLSVVRGLDYYTGTVFEAFDVERRFRALFGGGRYDNLLHYIGGRPAPAAGLGFGDVVLLELMKHLDRLPNPPPAADLLIGYMEAQQAPAAMRAARALRDKGDSVDLAMEAEKARAFFSRAGRSGARRAIFIGPDDVRAGRLRVKNLDQRTETVLRMESLEEQAS